MDKTIRKVGILGSGTMGSGLASHLANAGIPSILLDIVPRELTAEEAKKGLTLESPAVRNRIVNQNKINGVTKMKPPGIMRSDFADLIATGNLEDDLDQLLECDWVVEVVAERLDIKKSVLQKVAPFVKPGTIFTSNTSGISINRIAEDMPEKFRNYWCGTHFFNPIRYMSLVEIIPGNDTLPEVLDFLKNFMTRELGKTTVFCKDTPCFIANRVGGALMTDVLQLTEKHGLTFSQADAMTGVCLGRPKTATFRLFDLVGLDIGTTSAKTVRDNVTDPEEQKRFTAPDYIDRMMQDKLLGNKVGKGFYTRKGKEFLMYDPETNSYVAQVPADYESLKLADAQRKLPDKLAVLFDGSDVASELVWTHMKNYFSYVASLIPEISDDIYNVDVAMELGYNHKAGPFRTWNGLDLNKYVTRMEEEGTKVADWVKEMLAAGFKSFYTVIDGNEYYYSPQKKDYVPVEMPKDALINGKNTRLVAQLKDAALFDIGDNVLCLELQAKNAALSSDATDSILAACDELDKNWAAMVITSAGKNFCVGADLKGVLSLIKENKFDELEQALKHTQRVPMRLKYSRKPIVAAPFGMTLGGGCELAMHCSAIQAAGETYMGLVEIGVGVIPGSGGTKETVVRAVQKATSTNTPVVDYLMPALMSIGTAKTSSSGYDAMELGYMRPTDGVSLSRTYQLNDAKARALALVATNYRPPIARPFPVPNANDNALLLMIAQGMLMAEYMTEHDYLILEKLFFIMTGGGLSKNEMITEEYLLKLEREAFVELCREQKTQDRIEHMLKTGKALRN
ncbi:3-hydroxyacyl-CoA dehydrogenase/enoyl-CoA hydratase family protein [Eubacteriales bacterium OttesenSCG-928-K08]|nr:3-hydroxyacyl-CoA dehydrogenase/enoyl-CoA hydratase family protein [Eubacteriales bacterium OttesenSCG-928-K08]